MEMAEMRKTITKEQELTAFALFVMAKTREKEVRAFENQLNAILGEEDGSHFSDAIYGDWDEPSKAAFDETMAKAGISVGEAT
jgi:hypothetical protein